MTRTIQVENFYRVAKQIGLKRGEFTAKSPRDKYGEYQSMQVTIYKRLTETQTRELARFYRVVVYKRGGSIRWDMPLVVEGKQGLIIDDLDNLDEYGLPTRVKG
jgi:hypothetical protein